MVINFREIELHKEEKNHHMLSLREKSLVYILSGISCA